MLSDFHPLPRNVLDAGAGLFRSDTGISRSTRLNDPAMEVMTDLRSTLPVAIGPEDAIQIMPACSA